MRKLLLISFSIIFSAFCAFSQNSILNGQFLPEKKSIYNEKFTEGNYLILEENYPQALKVFLEAYQIDSTNSNINYKIGF